MMFKKLLYEAKEQILNDLKGFVYKASSSQVCTHFVKENKLYGPGKRDVQHYMY